MQKKKGEERIGREDHEHGAVPAVGQDAGGQPGDDHGAAGPPDEHPADPGQRGDPREKRGK